MKAAFITIHVGFNFGSVLQAIATSHLLQKHGMEPICVNYIPPRATFKRYWEEGIGNVKKMVRRFLFFPFYYKANKNFYGYLAKYCPLSRKIYAEDVFVKVCPNADIYITGSDQVWNYNHNEGTDKHYFFDGIKGRKIAFSSSIGMKDLPKEYFHYMKQALSEYGAISVREDSAVEILSSMGLQSTQLLDPTLLLDKEEWKPYASKRLVYEKYLFVYLPYNTKDEDLVYNTVRKIATKNNLTVVTYSRDFFKNKKADTTITFANPGDILSLILYADCVVTNSFHGTAFSINLNKQFWAYMPSKFSTRLESVLKLCKLEYRHIEELITDEQISEVVDFSESNEILDIERKKGNDYLNEIVRNVSE